MQNLIRSPGRKGYGALALFAVVYLAALGLVLAPEAFLTDNGAEVSAEG